MQISIIIPTFNRARQLITTLDCLSRQIMQECRTDSVEILAIDDGSEPDVIKAVQGYLCQSPRPFVRYILMPRNRGVSAARNLGVRESQGDVLVFLDDDIVPTDNFITATIELHRRYPNFLLVCGNLIPRNQNQYSEFWFHHYSAVFNRSGQDIYPISMLSSGNFSMKRSLLALENPLFDESLPSREDYDLYLRLKKRGMPVYKSDRIVAIIECRDNLRAFLKQRMWYRRGQERLIAKHGAQFIANESKALCVRPNKRYLHLYVLTRIALKLSHFHDRLVPFS